MIVQAVVDASVWLAAFNPNEHGHLESTAFFTEAAAQAIELAGPSIVLAEVAAGAARKSRDALEGDEAVTRLEATPRQQFHEGTLVRARTAAKAASRLFLKGSDSFYATLAAELGAELVTLDGELRTRAAAVVTALSPAEWLARHAPAHP